jgi:hypothetical protein
MDQPKRYYKFVENKNLQYDPQIGDQIKVLRNGESFWVEIISVPSAVVKSDYIVKVKNDLISNRFLWGDLIMLKRKYLFC